MIHRLKHGEAVCGRMPSPPSQWPEGDRWIAVTDDPAEVPAEDRCPGCFAWEEGMPIPRPTKRARVHVQVELESGEVFESSGEEILINAYDCGHKLKSATATELGQIDKAVREAVIGYAPKAEA